MIKAVKTGGFERRNQYAHLLIDICIGIRIQIGIGRRARDGGLAVQDHFRRHVYARERPTLNQQQELRTFAIRVGS